ncbi:MAG: hypothetical protein Q9175_004808 [Cornicularia normoerica]
MAVAGESSGRPLFANDGWTAVALAQQVQYVTATAYAPIPWSGPLLKIWYHAGMRPTPETK